MGFFKVDSDTPLTDCDIRMKFQMKEGSELLEITGTTSGEFLANAASSILEAADEVGVFETALDFYMRSLEKRFPNPMEGAMHSVFSGKKLVLLKMNLGEEKDEEISELKEKIEEQRRTIENLKILIASNGGSDERD